MFKNFLYRFKIYGFFRKLIISYAITFIVITLMSLSLFVVANKLVNRQFDSLSSALLSTFSQNAASNINTLNNLYMSVPQYFDIYDSDALDIQQRLKLKDFFNDTVSKSFINSISMYSLDNNEFTIENNTVLDPKTYYYSFYTSYNKSYEDWFKEISVVDSNPHYYFDTDNILRYQRTFIDNSGKYYNIIFILNSKVFFNYVQKNENIVLLYEKKCYGANSSISKIGQSYIDNNYTNTFKFMGSKYIATTMESGNSNITYAFIQPLGALQKSKIWFNVTFILNLIAYIIIGLFMSLVMTSQNFKPIESIISVLPKAAKSEDNVHTLSKHISAIIRQNRELNMLSQNYFSRIRFITLERMLCDYISPLISLDTLLNSAGISFPYDTFFVCVYRIEAVDETKPNVTTDKQEIYYALKNVSIDVFQGNNIIEFTDILDYLVCIINVPKQGSPEIPKLVEYIISFFEENMYVTLGFRISEPRNGLNDISACYKSCVSDFSDNNDEKDRYLNKLNDYELISTKFNDNYLNVETITTKLINLIHRGKGDLAVSYIEVYLQKGLHYAANTSNLKALLYDLLVSVMTAAENTQLNIIDEYFLISDSEELEEYFKKTLLLISKPFECNTVDEENVAYNIYDFLVKNYSDINLSVQMIGDYCNKVPSYASKIFSNEFDVNLMIFIQLYRINLAIKLLKNTSKSINIISAECGFTNANVFIRAFKKHTNITPGQYRSLVRHEDTPQ